MRQRIKRADRYAVMRLRRNTSNRLSLRHFADDFSAKSIDDDNKPADSAPDWWTHNSLTHLSVRIYLARLAITPTISLTMC